MKRKYSTVRSPKWANEENSKIDCVIKFSDLKVEVPFTADPLDTEAHGREIFETCAAGVHGPVAEYDSKPLVTKDHSPKNPTDPLISNWPEVNQFIEEANRENQAGTERSQILVWSSMIETLVYRLLESFFVKHPITKKALYSKEMTFSTAIDLSFCLELITKKEHKSCSNIRQIRNHVANNRSFGTSDQKIPRAFGSLYVADRSTLFEWSDDTAHQVKIVYTGSCGMLAVRLVDRIDSAAMHQRLILE